MRNYEIAIIGSRNLDRNVKVYVKLPNGYHESNDEYPVLYVHDGNVLFNDFEEVCLSWGMMDDFVKREQKKIIIVGIASGETRNDELIPFEIKRKDKEPTGGKTDDYMRYVIEELKPFIDITYRTKIDAESTGILGISVGGAATLYAAAKYQEHFSRFATMSSCHYPVQEEMLKLLVESNFNNVKKIYSDIGTEEHEVEKAKETYLRTNKEVYEVLKPKLNPGVGMFKVIEGSKHEFEHWNKRFPDMIDFLFS